MILKKIVRWYYGYYMDGWEDLTLRGKLSYVGRSLFMKLHIYRIYLMFKKNKGGSMMLDNLGITIEPKD